MDFFITFCKNVGKILTKYWKELLIDGVCNTLWISLIVIFFGAILGSVFAICKRSRVGILRGIVLVIVEVVRGTPALLQLYIGYFLVPMIVPFELSPLTCVAIALIINSAAYVSEIVRSGIEAVDKGQTEASRSLGLSSSTTMLRVVLPQAVKNILPALGNEFITVIKETSLASTFYIGELMTSYLIVVGQEYLAFESLMIVGALYFVLTFALSKMIGFAERKMKSHA